MITMVSICSWAIELDNFLAGVCCGGMPKKRHFHIIPFSIVS